MSEAFRVAAAPVATVDAPSAPEASDSATQPPTQNVQAAQDVKTDDPTLNIYEEVKGHPYTADFFHVDNYLEDPMFDGMSENVRSLDEFVRSEIRERGLKHTTDAYKEVIGQIESEIGAYDNEDTVERFNRFATAIKAIQRLRSVTRKPLLDSQNLSVKEYSLIFGRRSG